MGIPAEALLPFVFGENGSGGSVTVDAQLSSTSRNPVQNKAITGALADEYDASKTYDVGDLCIHNGSLYACITAIETPEAWNAAHWKTSNFGEELGEVNRQLSDKQNAPATAGTAGQVLGLDSNLNPAWMDQTGGGGGMNIVNLSGTQITQVGADNTFYVCGELTELTFTAPSVGITMIRFTSGTTPTVLTVNGVTSWMYDNDPTAASLEANKTYDINVLNGIGVVGWA